MSIPTTGSVSLSTIQTEFGGVEPISMSEYYKGSSNVPVTALNTLISTTGTISISNFRGSSKATFSVLPNSTNINEGNTVTFTVNTTDFGSGTLYWTLSTVSGTITNGDFSSPSNVLSGGSVSIVSNVGTVSLTLANDANTDGIDSFTLSIRVDSVSGTIVATSSTVTVADTSLTPTYSLARSTASVTEGNSFVITLTTTNVANGTVLPYSITGVDTADIDVPLTGSFTVQNNTASLTVNTNVNTDTSSTAYVLGQTADGQYVKEFTVSNDLSVTAYVRQFTTNDTAAGMYFRNDGTTLWLQDPNDDQFARYTMTTPWNIGTASSRTTASYGSSGSNHQGMWISPAGTTLFEVDRTAQTILQDTIPTWNPMTPGLPTRTLNIGTNGGITLPTGISVKPDGTRAFISTLSPSRTIAEYTGTAFRADLWTLNTTIQTPVGSFPTDVFVNDAGTRMYVTDGNGTNSAKIHYYELSSAWSLSSATFVRTWDLTAFFNDARASYIRVIETASESFVLSLSNGASSIAVTVVDP